MDLDSFELLFGEPDARKMSYWHSKPMTSRLVELPLPPEATDDDRAAVAKMLAGEFQPTHFYGPVSIGVPPPWDLNPFNSPTWDHWRHTLRWAEPLVAVWHTDGDQESLALMRAIVEDWYEHNKTEPGESPRAWSDAATANRLQRLLWFWELYRTSAAFDESFGRLMLEIIHLHATYCADSKNYQRRSNHGLMVTTALLEVASTCPEYADALTWRAIVDERLEGYISTNFGSAGFHFEQTPFYHRYILERLAAIMVYVRESGQTPIPHFDDAVRKIASVLPYLARPNGKLVNVGDGANQPLGDYRAQWREWWGQDVPSVAASTLPNPRNDGGAFLLGFDAGYAVFTTYPITTQNPDPDTYVLYKCNSFRYTHYHNDALSFVFYGLGQDWLIDSGGPYTYVAAQRRQYVASPRAHNLVLVDEGDSDVGSVALLDFGRNESGDFVKARHNMPNAVHTRTLTFQPPRTLEIRDELSSTDGIPHVFTQVFHTLPTLDVQIISDTLLKLTAANGRYCMIEQVGQAGRWRIINGQSEPYWQGWRTQRFEVLEPAPAIYFSGLRSQRDCEFVTRIWLGEG